MTAKTRILLADDHPIVLGGLRNLIAMEGDFELVGECTSGPAALKLIRETKPDLAIVDISMPGLNGIVLSRQLRAEIPSVRVLVLTLHEDRAYLRQALDAGARGYILKMSASEILVPAIRAVLAGGLYVDPALANQMFEYSRVRSGSPQAPARGPTLTERESEVLKFAAQGYTNKEIAGRLGVSVKTIETYKLRGMEKLGLKTRAEIVRYASAAGWLENI